MNQYTYIKNLLTFSFLLVVKVLFKTDRAEMTFLVFNSKYFKYIYLRMTWNSQNILKITAKYNLS